MIGLTILLAFAVYLLISFFVVRLTIRWAKRRGRSAWRWGIAATLFMYLVMFWDHIPTYALYKYYCNTRAGFWFYKTPEEWKIENDGVAKTLTWSKQSPTFTNPDGSWGFILNERFIWETAVRENEYLPVRITSEKIIDSKTNETMAERVSVGSGYSSGIKQFRFWVKHNPYIPYQHKFFSCWQAFKTIGWEENERNL